MRHNIVVSPFSGHLVLILRLFGLTNLPLKGEAAVTSESKEEAAEFGFRDAIADRAALLAGGGADLGKLKADYERFCQTSRTRNMKLEGVRCPESQVGRNSQLVFITTY